MAGEAMTEKSQTEELREALAQLPVRQMCCRAAEYAALIRYRRPTAAAEELCEHLRPGLERRGCLPESDDPIDTLTVCPSCPGAFLRGNVILGENCVIGNSTELKNCVLLNRVQVPHYNYVGDSVLGNGAHLGAGAICSNLKSDKSTVRVKTDNVVYDTGIRKFGAALADNADVGCGCVLNPGTVVGKNTRIYPLVSVRGVIPADRIVKSAECSVKMEVRPCAE